MRERGASGKTRRNIVSRMDPEFRDDCDDDSPDDVVIECEHCGREYDVEDAPACPHCADDAERWADLLQDA